MICSTFEETVQKWLTLGRADDVETELLSGGRVAHTMRKAKLRA